MIWTEKTVRIKISGECLAYFINSAAAVCLEHTKEGSITNEAEMVSDGRQPNSASFFPPY